MHRYAILALVLAGCAAPARTFQQPLDLYNPPAEFTHYYDALHADLFWRCEQDDLEGVRVDGYAVTSLRNNMAIVNFQVRLFARDAKGNILAERGAFGHRQSPSNLEPVPFVVSVPAAADVARHDLYYSFVLPDGNGGNGTAEGSPGVRTARLRMTARPNFFGTVEDVCGARWQRKVTPPAS